MAYGLDRLVMLMLGKDSIKDVIAFPKVQNSSELMTMCPSAVEEKNHAGAVHRRHRHRGRINNTSKKANRPRQSKARAVFIEK